ncbi:hypothetical protein M0802_014837 [Mischocyttarus mexicanus]|nr:hypothetical protein M0802_014837 [Mischocyttarus mexicanus]
MALTGVDAITDKEKFKIYEEPKIQTAAGLSKPDVILCDDSVAYVVDAQVINDQYDLEKGYKDKAKKYERISNNIKELTRKELDKFGTLTLSWKGLWSKKAIKDLLD